MGEVKTVKTKVYYGEYSLWHWINLILKKDIVLPDYQRFFVWNKEKTEQLISSIKNGEFIPPVTIGHYYNKNGERENIIIDGQQRLTSILLHFLGIFPNRNFKPDEVPRYIDPNDNDYDSDIVNEMIDDVLDWSFKALTAKGTTKEEILSEIDKLDEGNYINLGEVSESFFTKHYLGFSFIAPQSVEETEEKFFSEQQNFYSTVFRNINIQGKELLPQESRKSLYFLRDEMVGFFEPNFAKSVQVNGGQMDFVRYLALLSNYCARPAFSKKRIALGYATKMEDFYAKFINFVVNKEDDNKDFAQFSKEITEGNFETNINLLTNLAESLSLIREFQSIIDLDVCYFGLIYVTIFLGKKIDISKKIDLNRELNQLIESYKSDYLHKKNPAVLFRLTSRLEESICIYRKYLE